MRQGLSYSLSGNGLQLGDHIISELFAGGAVLVVGDDNSLFLVAGGHGGGQPVSGLYHADMAEQKLRSLDKAGRIGIFA